MAEDTIRCGEDLLKTAKAASAYFPSATIWYRGVKRAGYALVPSIFRNEVAKYEHTLATDFRHKARFRHSRCPDFDDWPVWLTLMQHYRLPTRLLDWTESILVAAFFAVRDWKSQGDAAIWAFAPGHLNECTVQKGGLFSLGNKLVRPVLAPPFDSEAPPSSLTVAVVSEEFDLRMLVQQAAYTIHGTAEPLEKRADHGRFVRKFVIPENAKRTIGADLDFLSIEQSHLFPDLENLADDLSQRWLNIARHRERGLPDKAGGHAGEPELGEPRA